MAAREPIRLVIWDLDETFWRGTLTEGGIQEYVEAHHDLVIELARRGIMSSICSKNDFETVRKICVERGIWDYFIFSSIDWTPKPSRIKEIIDNVQLRAPTVLFIDDNASNRASVAEHVPGIQVESELFIAEMLDSPLFKGKDDRSFSRLQQYKILEKRKEDQIAAGNDDKAFLRTSGITVEIETDVMPHIDRAVELINRTNQLNFTKVRLPDDPQQARDQLAQEIRFHGTQCGLVKVHDKYGDYGFVGFYLVKWRKLIHFCFSCRTLGFGVESWVYEKLRRPAIDIVGEVLTDLSVPQEIDWINNRGFGNTEAKAHDQLVDRLTLNIRGGCEVEMLRHYFEFDNVNVLAESQLNVNKIILPGDSLWNLHLSARQDNGLEVNELRKLGFGIDKTVSRFFSQREFASNPLVLFCGTDFNLTHTYIHKKLGFRLNIYLDGVFGNLCSLSDDAMADHLSRNFSISANERKNILDKCKIIKSDYEYSVWDSAGSLHDAKAYLEGVFRMASSCPGLFLVTRHRMSRNSAGLYENQKTVKFNEIVSSVAPKFPNVRVLNAGDFLLSDDEILDEAHYSRIVYFRIYKEIRKQMASLPSRPRLSS